MAKLKRNRASKRDADASWTKKAGNFKHGYRMHNGVDKDSGLITANKTTTAKVHDVMVGNDLLHGNEEEVLNNSCEFALWKNNRFFEAKKKTLTKEAAKALLNDGCVFMSGLYSEKTGKTYSAVITLEDGDQFRGYVKFGMEFDNSKHGDGERKAKDKS